MLTNLVLLATTMGSVSATARAPSEGWAYDHPRIEVWTNRGDDPYRTGQRARVYLRYDRDAYVTLFRVDTDGRVRVLFPLEPWEDNFVRGGSEFAVSGGHVGDAFEIDDYPGVGYVFAVAATDPYAYDPITSGDHWDYRAIADGRVRGDPYVALTDLAERLLPPGYGDWDYDIVPYYVERHYDYPRFLCYDCHSYASYRYWDPYAYSCVRFRIVVYDDPYYYPYRYYGGTRVVFTRPYRPEPRFIFKDRGGVGDDRFVTRVRQRPVNDNGRRGIRGVDLGGRGSIPVPRTDEPRRRPDRGREPEHVDRPGRPEDRGQGWERRWPETQRPERRSNTEQPARRPDSPARADDAQGRPAERSGQTVARPRGNDRSDQRERPTAEPRVERPPQGPREAPRRAEPRNEGRNQPTPDRPRAEARRGRDPAPAAGSPKGQPQLKRRRP